MSQPKDKSVAKDRILGELMAAKKRLTKIVIFAGKDNCGLELIKETEKARKHLNLAHQLLLVYHLKFCLTDKEKFAEEAIKTYRYRD